MAEERRPNSPSRAEDEDKLSPARIAAGFVSGDAEATRCVRERVERILAFRGYRIPPEDRRDLEQEVMTQLWQAVRQPSFEVGAGFWKFIEIVVVRRCIDWVRTRKQTLPLEVSVLDDRDDPLDDVLARERHELARAALAKLKKPCRDLIYFHSTLMMSYRQISKKVGKSEGALRVQLFRCIQEARTILKELETEVRLNRG
jgi:RNA polymerase sigma factor (sigma-70 family)